MAGRNPKMMVVMDPDTGRVIGQPFPIGDRVDATVYDPATGTIAASRREGTIHVFHEDSPDKISVVEKRRIETNASKTRLAFLTNRVGLLAKILQEPANRGMGSC